LVGRLFVHRDVSAVREAERAKDEFLALVSHELRTPLTSVIGYLELLLDGEAGPLVGDQRRFTEVAERNARRLLRLVGDLLVVAQAEAGRLGLATGPVDLEALALERIEAARPAAEAAGVALAARGEPVLVDGDRGRLGQVIDNLLGNAVRHTPAGGAVRLEVALRDGTALVEVADSGPGIPAAELPHVFGRFWRGRGAHGTAGSGLGLAICQLIGEAHGGTVEAASPPGGGAVMRLRLPPAPAPPYPAGSSAPADAPAAILRAT
jgi:signal transduction histidine kinase